MTKRKEDHETKTVFLHNYKARQAESFQSLGTTAADWEVCDIIGVYSGDIPDYELPPYDEVRPYFDKLVIEIGRDAADAYVASAEFGCICQLCGCRKVKYACPIQCDSKKLMMFVGTECVTNFMDANQNVTKQIRLYKENKLRELFRKWVYNGINQCYAYREHGNRSPLIYDYWKFKRKLEDMQDYLEQYSSRQIRNTFKKASGLGLVIPRDSILGFREDVI